MNNDQLQKGNELTNQIRRVKDFLESMDKPISESNADPKFQRIFIYHYRDNDFISSDNHISDSCKKTILTLIKAEATDKLRKLEKEFELL